MGLCSVAGTEVDVVEVDAVEGGHPTGAATGDLLLGGELPGAQGQGVVHPRIEVRELVDPVKDVGDELLEEDPRRDPDPAAQPASNGIGEVGDIGIIDDPADAFRHSRTRGIQVAHPNPEDYQHGVVEAG